MTEQTYIAELEATQTKLLDALKRIRDGEEPNPMWHRQIAAEVVEDVEGCGA